MIPQDMFRLDHIRESISKIRDYTKGGREELKASSLIQDAVIWNLTTIGEATFFVSTELKIKKPEIAWKEITNLRRIGTPVEPDWLWNIVQSILDPLDRAVLELQRHQ